MKTLYLDLSMGAAGDMLTAALLELTDTPEEVVKELNALGLHGVCFEAEESVKCGVRGTHMHVTVHGHEEAEAHGHEHGHHHSSMDEIAHIVSHLNIPEAVQKDVMAVYTDIAEAESRVHGVPVTDVHFHEVGALDAIADICAVCLLMERLAPDEVIASPVCTGSGSVRCAHGILPVPAPATLELLKDIPFYSGEIKGELLTPTGAALLRRFVGRFGDMPVMRARKIGYGMGRKDFPQANCVRALLGEAQDRVEDMLELACNIDDMTAEAIAFAAERLFEGGARDVFTVPIGMKKSRPGTLIGVICDRDRRDEMIRLLFKHTTTLGVRETAVKRYTLTRRETTVETPFGEVRRKDASGYGATQSKYEYEDLARIARENGLSLSEVISRIDG